MTTNRRSELADRLITGGNGDPDQRAATQLLCTGAGGIWLSKLDGWPQYLRALEDDRHPDALWVDWHQLREDLAADEDAWSTFNDWANSYAGRRATEAEYKTHLAAAVPHRPWHGASSSELVLMRIALELAPGGRPGEGIPRLDRHNVRAADAIDELATGRIVPPRRPVVDDQSMTVVQSTDDVLMVLNRLVGESVAELQVLGVNSLKSVSPSPGDLVGSRITAVSVDERTLTIEVDGCTATVDLQRTGRLRWLDTAPSAQVGRSSLPTIRLILQSGAGLDFSEPGRTKRISLMLRDTGPQ